MVANRVDDTDGKVFEATFEAFESADGVTRGDDDQAMSIAENYMDSPERAACWLTGEGDYTC